MKEKCVLYDRDCINCGECEFCDLDPTKICDNCGKCLETGVKEFATIKIDKILSADGSEFVVDNGSDDDCDCDDNDCGEEQPRNHKHNH